MSFIYLYPLQLTTLYVAKLGPVFLRILGKMSPLYKVLIQGGSNTTGTDFFFFFVTIIAHHSSNSQTRLNRF